MIINKAGMGWLTGLLLPHSNAEAT